MRILATVLILFSILNIVFANDIDNLKTKGDVQKFLVGKVNPKWNNKDFFETLDTLTYSKDAFYKLDLDNNGLTDLLIYGKYLFAVTDSGNGHYKCHFIDRGAFMSDKYTLINIIYQDKIPLLIIGGISEFEEKKIEKDKIDTLILKFGDFVEFNSKTDNLKIKEIKLKTSGCFGRCPIFEITVLSDRSATYNAIKFNDRQGLFKAKIDSISFYKLLKTINYIKLLSLKDYYSVDWTDDETVDIEVLYDNGRLKRISDYGAIGTFGLENLYNQIFGLRTTQGWR